MDQHHAPARVAKKTKSDKDAELLMAVEKKKQDERRAIATEKKKLMAEERKKQAAEEKKAGIEHDMSYKQTSQSLNKPPSGDKKQKAKPAQMPPAAKPAHAAKATKMAAVH